MSIRSKKLATLLIASAILALSLPTLALAGKGGRGGSGGGSGGSTGSSGSLSLVPLYTHAGGPVFRDQVTFSVSTTASTPSVENKCYQGTTLVSSETRGFYPDYPWATTYTLGPTYVWVSGAATCTAKLTAAGSKGTVVLASITYSVAAA
jgi:hypothetical protein